MLRFRSLSLFQFKNYFHEEFRFSERLVGICGRNGRGKTNLLDALHYLCFTKSYFTRQDSLVTQHGHSGFRLDGHLTLHDRPEQAVCILRENGKKEFMVNGEAYTRFSRHIGRYPCVVIAPDDIQLILGTSEERRKFADTLLSQLDPEYLQSLIQYTRILQQRNSFLRNFEDSYGRDLSVLDILDEQLAREGDHLFEKRRSFLLGFLPEVKQLYNEIARQYEPVELIYESELHQTDMAELLRRNRPKDLILGRTGGGVHRDDLLFTMGGQPFRSIASQGQRKSLLFSLKLAERTELRRQKKMDPLLLLDDVFEKLDEERIGNLLLQVCTDNDGQIFITDTNCQRLTTQLEAVGQPFQIIELA
ncbi:MAG TPA: DNA replication and repair protein RecF [Chitinophagaceae bacterium]|jgi:DNA replication and repair protein RecF|nr:DNA replication and repair protein RecF [Chitinophagaceae bacterium]